MLSKVRKSKIWVPMLGVVGVLLILFVYMKHYSHTRQSHAVALPRSGGISRIQNINTGIGRNTEVCKNLTEELIPFNGPQKFTHCCKTCTIVSSAGTMLGSLSGSEIDSSDCVIRMNNAPTEGFEVDVGTRTKFRVFSHTSMVDVKRLLSKNKSEVNSTTFIVWGPEKNMAPGKITYNYLKAIIKSHPNINIYVLSQKRIKKADDIFEIETGKNRLGSGAYLSTGWFTVLFAKDVCKKIHIYGMVEDTHCETIKAKLLDDVQYHYYQHGKGQCATYNAHEHAKAAAHRFLSEKKVFKKWAKDWRNIQFHHPEWNLD